MNILWHDAGLLGGRGNVEDPCRHAPAPEAGLLAWQVGWVTSAFLWPLLAAQNDSSMTLRNSGGRMNGWRLLNLFRG
jgi:hypothetical protein